MILVAVLRYWQPVSLECLEYILQNKTMLEDKCKCAFMNLQY